MFNLFCSSVCETNNNYLICIQKKQHVGWGFQLHIFFGVSNQPTIWHRVVTLQGSLGSLFSSRPGSSNLAHQSVTRPQGGSSRIREGFGGLVVWCWWVFNGLKYRFFFSRNVFFNPFDFSDMWLRGYDLVALWRRCWSFCSLKKQGEREVFCVLVSLSTWSFMFPWFGVFENVNVMLELELFISPMIKTPFFRG